MSDLNASVTGTSEQRGQVPEPKLPPERSCSSYVTCGRHMATSRP